MLNNAEQHVIGLLNAAYENVTACIKAHEHYQCEVSKRDVTQAMKELETMKELASQFAKNKGY